MTGSNPTPKVDQILSLLDDVSTALKDLSDGRNGQVEAKIQKLCSSINELNSPPQHSGDVEEHPGHPNTIRALFFHQLNEAALVYEAVRDAAGNVTDWIFRDANNAAMQTLGFEREAFVGKKASQLYGAGWLERTAPQILQVLTTGEPCQREEQSGERHFLVSMFRIDENTVARLSTDITEKKQAEAYARKANAALAWRETGYKELAESINDGFMELNRDWRFTYVNQRAASNAGLSPADLVGKNIWDRFPALLGTPYEKYYRQVMDRRQPARFESEDVYQWKHYDVRVFPSAKGIAIFWTDITERKQVEKEVLQQKLAFERLAENSPDIIARFDRQHRHIYINSAIQKFTGRTPADYLGKTNEDLGFPQELCEQWRAILAGVFSRGAADSFEFTFPGPFGEDFVFQWMVVPEFDENGNVETALSIARDMSKQKHIELNLRESEAEFRQLAEAMPHLVFGSKADGTIDYYNQHAREYSGFNQAADGQWHWELAVHPHDSQATVDAWHNVVQNGVGYEIEHRLQLADGTYRWHITRVVPLKNEHGDIIRWYGSATDIETLKQTEQALRESESKFHAVFQNATYAIALTGQDDELIVDVNPAWTKLFGVEREEAIGRSTLALGTFPDPEIHQRAYETLREQGCLRHFENICRTKSGETILVSNSADLVTINGAKYVLNTLENITERTQAIAALAASEAKYRTLYEAMDEGFMLSEVIYDENGQPVDVLYHEANPAAVRLLGIDYTGRRLSEIDPAFEQHWFDIWDRVARTGVSERLEQYAEPLNSWYNFYIFRMGGPESRLVVNVFQDITERKLAEEALRESEEAQRRSAANERARANELEALMDAAPAVIWISRDPECREMIGNRYSYDFLRIGQGENVSKTADNKDHSAQHYHMEKDGRPVSAADLPMQIAAATGKPTLDYSFDLVYEDGTVFHMFGNVNPLLDRDGKPYGAIGVFVDLTAMHRLEEEKIAAKAEIEVQSRLMDQREQERQALARDLHDGPIQTLSSTTFYLQMIKDIFTDPALHVELNQIGMNIKASIQELRGVLYDLRPPALNHFGFSRVIQMYTQDLRERFPNIEIDMDVVDNDDQLLSDQARLALFRIYQAGINNILRHSGASKAWVVYKIHQESFLLELRDNGVGFAISKDFAQLTREGHFGLVGMKERTEAIGGEFMAFSAPGKGTSIVIKGPLNGKNLR